jgi:Mn-dependent DtxR family transcriptional regulator
VDCAEAVLRALESAGGAAAVDALVPLCGREWLLKALRRLERAGYVEVIRGRVAYAPREPTYTDEEVERYLGPEYLAFLRCVRRRGLASLRDVAECLGVRFDASAKTKISKMGNKLYEYGLLEKKTGPVVRLRR